MDEEEKCYETEPLGCHLTSQGARFKIYAPHVTSMILEVYARAQDQTPIYKGSMQRVPSSDYVTLIVPGVIAGMYYVWRMMMADGGYSPTIMDPYAKGVYRYEGEWRNLIVAPSQFQCPKPQLTWQQTIIYELHVGHFTHEDPTCPIEERGTLRGLIRRLPYLKQLGITTIELLPIFKWYPHILKNISPITGKMLEDVWGYNPLSFFAVEPRYSVKKTSEGALEELKDLVEAVHQMQMEIILDVVYNHTGEGGENGIKVHFKYLAPEVYYKWSDQQTYLNCAGTGNTLNNNHPVVKQLIKDSLSYWAEEIGIDGFRFDLVSILGQDEKGHWLKESLLNELATLPALAHTKLITESWDAKGSYDVGRMPAPFAEWSDYFRDTMRKFVKGDQGIIQAVVACLSGKEIFFTDPLKGSNQSIHFITAHDGFTLNDLVSYNQKHNEANGEDNRDGHNANYTYNWGVEGDTDQEEILHQRQKIKRNLYSLLLLSKGTPMILMGDELGRTQKGNNNAFCQDNELVWVDWTKQETLYDFVEGVIRLRKQLDYYKHAEDYQLSWHGVKWNQPDLSYYSRSIACYILGKESLFLIANSYYESLSFDLPVIEGKWVQVLNTSQTDALKHQEIMTSQVVMQPYSVCLYKAENL